MALAAVEQIMATAGTGAILVDPRLVRRVIKAHRELPGLGLHVPHAHVYALSRETLLTLVDPHDLGVDPEQLASDVVLVARPEAGDVAGESTAATLRRVWRSSFHGFVHLELERRMASGSLSDAMIRERIDRIGQIEFDEVRAILRLDDHLLPPHGDREAYVEFAALYLELRHFAPSLVATTFPGLLARDRVDVVVGSDVDALAVLSRACPEGAEPLPTIARPAPETSSPSFSAPATIPSMGRARAPTAARSRRLVASADRAKRKGNLVRSALLRSVAATGDDPELCAKARAGARADLEMLGARLNEALRPPAASAPANRRRGQGGSSLPLEWTSQLLILAEEAAARRGLRFPIEARLLYDLQRAAIAHERPERAVDLVTWATSLGKVPVVRPLPATRPLRIARIIHAAVPRVRHVRIVAPERKLLARLLRVAADRADDNVRAVLRPELCAILESVGLAAQNVPEKVARDKLVEELLDLAVATGILSIGQLRDALSRNQLKLENVKGVREILFGDALIDADRRLSRALDGVYRRGEIYLYALQKLSSIAFGTAVGRFLTLYVALPIAAAYVLIEGVVHIVAPISRWLGFGDVPLPSLPFFLVTAGVIFGLIHSEAVRRAAWRALSVLGVILAFAFIRFPRWILTRPAVRRVLANPGLRAAFRRVIVPLGVSAAAVGLTPLRFESAPRILGVSIILFAGSSWAFNSRVASFLEDLVLDWLAPTWRTLSRRLLPGLLRLVIDTFRRLIELVERVIYRVDELLRFREGQHRFVLYPKAALGLIWFFVAYVARLYITLLVEPELNPVKHFPVVTVAHKIMIPLTGELLPIVSRLLSPLGPVVGGAIAGTTVFLLPSVFGFLVWELKENWNLYRASRPRTLRAVRVGHHGETMGALMVPGFHSGTLPKLWARLRRAAEREEDGVSAREGAERRAEGSLGRFREGLHEVERSVSRFVERELVAIVLESRSWSHGPIEVVAVELSSNRVRVELRCPALGEETCEVAFEEQSELLVASVPRSGFLDALPDDPSDDRVLFENALAGLYQYAGVDLVREQIEAELGDVPYDVSDEGLVVWPGSGYRTEAIYSLRSMEDGPLIEPKLRGDPIARPPPPLDERKVLFSQQAISWAAWVYAWNATVDGDSGSLPLPRLLQGPSILPARPRSSAAMSRPNAARSR